MRRALLCSLVLLTCAPAEDVGGPRVHPRRDPFPIVSTTPPVATGLTTSSRMGETVALCDGEFLASGADGVVWAESNLFTNLQRATGPGARLP
ncbi:MAG: hypothetical protein JNM17_41260 [Archangium sp.]|nr:hypothetical protein [Archangium sp.]